MNELARTLMGDKVTRVHGNCHLPKQLCAAKNWVPQEIATTIFPLE